MASERAPGRLPLDSALSIWALLTLFLLPIYPKIGLVSVPGTYIPVRADDILIAILGVLWLLSLIAARRRPNLPPLIVVAAAAWIAATLVALLVGSLLLGSIALGTGLAFWAKPIEYLLLGFVCYDLVRSQIVSVRALLVAIFASAAIVIGYGVLEHFALVPRMPGTRAQPGVVTSTIGDMHEFASYAGIIGLMSVALWHRATRTPFRVAALGGLAMLLMTMFYTGARSEYVAIGVGLLGLALWKPSRLPAAVGIAVMVALFVAPIAVDSLRPRSAPPTDPPQVAAPGVGSRNVWERFQGEVFGQSFEERFGKWQRMLHAASASPIVGLGPSAATEAADGYYVRSYVESGIVGLTAFLSMVAVIFISAWRQASQSAGFARALAVGLLASTAFVALVGILIDSWVASRVMELYWPLVGISLGAATYAATVKEPDETLIPVAVSNSAA
jgi:hypothetical protein